MPAFSRSSTTSWSFGLFPRVCMKVKHSLRFLGKMLAFISSSTTGKSEAIPLIVKASVTSFLSSFDNSSLEI